MLKGYAMPSVIINASSLEPTILCPLTEICST